MAFSGASILTAVVVGTSSAVVPTIPGVTDFERALLDNTVGPAAAASASAESELLQSFAQLDFQHALAAYGDDYAKQLASMSPAELLQRVKDNLDCTEYTTNFNISHDAWSKQTWAATPNIGHVDTYGFLPNLWQLKVRNDPLVESYDFRIPEDAVERELYKLKSFQDVAHPTWDEAAERGQYIFENLHRLDLGGDWNFGSYVAVYRNSVMRDRSLMVPADSGGWYMDCKAGTSKPNFNCDSDGISFDEPPGRATAQMHLFVRLAKLYQKINSNGFFGQLALQVWHLLDPQATLEGLKDMPEAIVLGSVKMSDLKFIVASFALSFGTPEGDALIDFCNRHELPLAWAVGDGVVHTQQYELSSPVAAGSSRILDVATVKFTNGSVQTSETMSVWQRVSSEMRAARLRGSLSQAQVLQWWQELKDAKTTVRPLRGGDCSDWDCLGVEVVSNQCICRKSAVSPAPTPAPTFAPTPPRPSPSPSGCPGGSMAACMRLCPADPTGYQACVKDCDIRCQSEIVV